MKTKILKTLILGTTCLTIVACSSIQPNPEISATQSRLSAAYSDKNTVDRGRSDLSSADAALRAAQAEWDDGNTEESDHHLTMSKTYLDLADTRGKQAAIEQEITNFKAQSQMLAVREQAQKDELMNQERLADKDEQLARAQETRRQDDIRHQEDMADKDRQLELAREQLREYDMKVTELGTTLVLQDVSFAFGKAELQEGALNRLQPLINFLKVSPETQVRIEGHTDNVGAKEYNRQLSQARADSVKDLLTANGIDANRIETVGSGYSKPVSSNDTVSGRQANRRVEITLLK